MASTKIDTLSQGQALAVVDSAGEKRGKVRKSNEGVAYQVARRIYCFQLSLPASRPPPVSLLPPKAPPISAPLVPILTFTIPQSDPKGLYQREVNN